jgi:hypothetical protein
MTNESTFEPAFIDWLTDVAQQEVTELSTLDRSELADLWLRVEALRDIATSVERKVRAELSLILDTPIVLADGRVLKRKRSARRTSWMNTLLSARLVDALAENIVDASSGEARKLLDPAKMHGLFDPTHAVTKLTAHGIDPKLYCDEEWAETIEVIR